MSSSTTATTSPKKRPLFEVSGGEVLGAGGLNDEIRQSSKRSRFSIDDLLRATEKEIPKQLLIPSGSEAEESNLHSPHSPTSTTRTDSPPTAQTSPLLLAEVECRLEGAELWAKFYDLGTEMIITKSGRRMFPTVKVSVSTPDLDALYYVFLDVVPVDTKRYRYIYNKSSWLTAGKAEPAPVNRLYMHPDSPFTGDQLQLQKQMVSFEKAKLTNNDVEKTSHLILNSMHKYQPRVHIVKRDRNNPMEGSVLASLTKENHRTFVFPETQFMAVTAYQNQLITKLKIEKNPFAKGFRDPSGRDSDYESSESRPEMRSILSSLYNPALLQHALFSQYWMGKYPSLLSHVLLSSSGLPGAPMATPAALASPQSEPLCLLSSSPPSQPPSTAPPSPIRDQQPSPLSAASSA